MANEIEVAAAASLGGFFRFRRKMEHAAAPGTPCANCATPLEGPWCYACGQLGEDFHRSIGHLVGEVFESFFHADGRIWRTLPTLAVHPARLTRDYLDGHRAPQIPPLRLFLVVLLAIFLVGGLTGGSTFTARRPGTPVPIKGTDNAVVVTDLDQLTSEQQAKVKATLGKVDVRLGGDKPNVAATQWLRDRLGRTMEDPKRFQLILEEWSERFAFLMLPVSALLLSLVFIFQRRFYLFDHTIFSLHSLSAVGILLILAMSLDAFIDGWPFMLLCLAPIHLFVHMRGVYRISIAGTLIRMSMLFIGAVVAAILLLLGLVAVGLNGMS